MTPPRLTSERLRGLHPPRYAAVRSTHCRPTVNRLWAGSTTGGPTKQARGSSVCGNSGNLESVSYGKVDKRTNSNPLLPPLPPKILPLSFTSFQLFRIVTWALPTNYETPAPPRYFLQEDNRARGEERIFREGVAAISCCSDARAAAGCRGKVGGGPRRGRGGVAMNLVEWVCPCPPDFFELC